MTAKEKRYSMLKKAIRPAGRQASRKVQEMRDTEGMTPTSGRQACRKGD